MHCYWPWRGGLGIPLLLILLDESENAFADIHSAAVSTGLLVRMKVEHLALAIGVLCTLIALLAPLAQYQNFLLLIGSVFAPLFGVVLMDHFVIRRRQMPAAISGTGRRWSPGRWGWRHITSWPMSHRSWGDPAGTAAGRGTAWPAEPQPRPGNSSGLSTPLRRG